MCNPRQKSQDARSSRWSRPLVALVWMMGLVLTMAGTTGCEATAGFYVENDVYTDFAVPGKPDMRTSLKLEFKDPHFLERSRK